MTSLGYDARVIARVRDSHGAVIGEVHSGSPEGYTAVFRGRLILAAFRIRGEDRHRPRGFVQVAGAVEAIHRRWAAANLRTERVR